MKCFTELVIWHHHYIEYPHSSEQCPIDFVLGRSKHSLDVWRTPAYPHRRAFGGRNTVRRSTQIGDYRHPRFANSDIGITFLVLNFILYKIHINMRNSIQKKLIKWILQQFFSKNLLLVLLANFVIFHINNEIISKRLTNDTKFQNTKKPKRDQMINCKLTANGRENNIK
jgi:hypothetical protein